MWNSRSRRCLMAGIWRMRGCVLDYGRFLKVTEMDKQSCIVPGTAFSFRPASTRQSHCFINNTNSQDSSSIATQRSRHTSRRSRTIFANLQNLKLSQDSRHLRQLAGQNEGSRIHDREGYEVTFQSMTTQAWTHPALCYSHLRPQQRRP